MGNGDRDDEKQGVVNDPQERSPQEKKAMDRLMKMIRKYGIRNVLPTVGKDGKIIKAAKYP